MKRTMVILLNILLVSCLLGCVTADFPELTSSAPPTSFAKGQFVIGPEDVLRVEVWKDQDLSRDVTVRPDGLITLPLVGDVQAEGLNVQQLRKILTKSYEKYVEAPNISVSLVAINSFKVFIVGKVNSPGVFPTRSNTTILQAISMAGGFAEWATPDKIILVRQDDGQEKHYRINYDKIVSGTAPDIYLHKNDRLIVQ
ncbi:MAG: polysaccharide export protein [Xanthomonadaceae bacterium]|nr:polysaccharide export protein [Xanthomonadaceae bacterium]